MSGTVNPYLDAYLAQVRHEQNAPGCLPRLHRADQADGWCGRIGSCPDCRSRGDMVRAYSWAIPNDAALTAIADHGPIVEIGAGGGYWTKLLRDRGVDVVAYDPDPIGGSSGERKGWHDGTRWSHVETGDHTAVTAHPDRTLLLVWPSYDEPWTDAVIDLYGGNTVIYVGEGPGGCTGTGRLHTLLGDEPYCWHDDEDTCHCGTGVEARFKQVAEVRIPQWGGIHDRLGVYERIGGAS